MTKDEALKIENSDFNNYTKQKLFEYIVELRKALSTHPAPSWQGLSDSVVMEIVWDLEHITDKDLFVVEYYRAIEQALRNKNGY